MPKRKNKPVFATGGTSRSHHVLWEPRPSFLLKLAKGKERARDSWRENRERFMFAESSTNNRAHLPAKIQRGKSGSPGVNSKPRQVYAQPDYFALFLFFAYFFPRAVCLFAIFASFSPKSLPEPPTTLTLVPGAFPLNQDHTQHINKPSALIFVPHFRFQREGQTNNLLGSICQLSHSLAIKQRHIL